MLGERLWLQIPGSKYVKGEDRREMFAYDAKLKPEIDLKSVPNISKV